MHGWRRGSKMPTHMSERLEPAKTQAGVLLTTGSRHDTRNTDMSSINTNNGAMVALQTLKSINKDLAATQNQISTGKAVATAKDGSAIC